MELNIKLTTAQQELHTKYSLSGATNHREHYLTITDLDTYRHDLETLLQILQNEPYTHTQSRHRFAALYLLKKINGHTTVTTTPAPADLLIEVGQTIYLLHHNEGQTFTVKSLNPDGSICLFGGTTHYQGYRDIRPENLTHKRPRSMPKIRATDIVD